MINLGGNLITNLNGIAGGFTSKTAASGTDVIEDFKDALNEALNRFQRIGDEDAMSTLDLLTGNTDDLSETMITAQKSELALELTVAIRNKAVDAYKEIMNMQV